MESRLKKRLIKNLKLSKKLAYHIWCPHLVQKFNLTKHHLLCNLLVTMFYPFTCEDYFFSILLHSFTQLAWYVKVYFWQENKEKEEAKDINFMNYNDVMEKINTYEEGNKNSNILDCETKNSLYVHLYFM